MLNRGQLDKAKKPKSRSHDIINTMLHARGDRGDLTPRMSVTQSKAGTPRSSFQSRKPPRRQRPLTASRIQKLKVPTKQRRPLSSARGRERMEGSLTARSKNTGMFPGGSATLSSSKSKPIKKKKRSIGFFGRSKWSTQNPCQKNPQVSADAVPTILCQG